MRIIHYNRQYKPFAQKLRRDMTRQEKHLWYDFLQKLPIQIRRQKQFGDYIVDFYCSSLKMVIELDGSQHYQEEGPEKDQLRDEYLKSLGLNVVRIQNVEIDENFDGVCKYLWMLMGLPEPD